jgi:hypothetical protein
MALSACNLCPRDSERKSRLLQRCEPGARSLLREHLRPSPKSARSALPGPEVAKECSHGRQPVVILAPHALQPREGPTTNFRASSMCYSLRLLPIAKEPSQHKHKRQHEVHRNQHVDRLH